jgi:hypothetical protein
VGVADQGGLDGDHEIATEDGLQTPAIATPLTAAITGLGKSCSEFSTCPAPA